MGLPPYKNQKIKSISIGLLNRRKLMEIIVYTINNCGYCEAAKELLRRKNLNFRDVNLSGKQEETMELLRKTAHRTFPQIFIDGSFVGGFNELKAKLQG